MEEKIKYARRDSAELALERKQSNTLARFKETQRKNSGKSSVDSFHDLFYAPNRPSQKAVDYFQNRPRTADTYKHERTPSNSSSCSQSSTLSQSKTLFKSYQDCKKEITKRTVLFCFIFRANKINPCFRWSRTRQTSCPVGP